MAKTRTLRDGKQVPELDKAVELKVYTKCPEKYLLLDRETGQLYTGVNTEDGMDWKLLNESKDRN